ncbi:choline dehydrogenase-like flavoprotein [Neobacillus niacini]|uniref:GMC family oxidoreductase n=1 Tax=Neobacillus driksii TaxID=3035913 RepID=UPI002782E852|nr:GMC family oxidoreductase [Neobacillus niacini]MDQ0972217.1 choline dehydrogenase-like flavoprotein [Neobacillus niacini]
MNMNSLPNMPFFPVGHPPKTMNHWIPTVTLEEMSNKEYDVIIVGSGAGGGAVLWRLCEKWADEGMRIGMIEAGDLLAPTHVRNLPTIPADRFPEYLYNPNYTSYSSKYSSNLPEAIEVNALGGRTLFWTQISPRMDSVEMATWPVSLKEMNDYYSIAEKAMNVSQSFFKGSPITETMIGRLHEAGFTDSTYIPMAADLQATYQGEIHSNVFFSSISFLARAMKRSFDLAVRAKAVEVYAEGGSVQGLRVMTPEKKSYTIKAKNVVLSASTFETPRILLNSGIKGDAIGHYLANHSGVRASTTVPRKKFPEPLGALGVFIPQGEHCPYMLAMLDPLTWHTQEQERPFQEEVRINIGGYGKVESRFENQISLDPARKDEFGVPMLNIDFSYSDNDQMVIQQMIDSCREILRKVAGDNDPSVYLMPIGSDYHETGTCRMGEDPATSATNCYGQIHGVEGLFVADNSVLPTVGRANPTLTTVAFAIRTADYIFETQKNNTKKGTMIAKK